MSTPRHNLTSLALRKLCIVCMGGTGSVATFAFTLALILATVVSANAGNLEVTVKNQNGVVTPNATVIRYTSSWGYLDEKITNQYGKVTWLNITAGEYKLEAYYNGEYWINGSATVPSSGTAYVTLQRNEPFAYQFAVFNANTNEEVTNGTVLSGTPLRYEVRVRNSSPVDRNARVKFWVDRSQTSPYDFYQTSSYQSVSKNDGTRTFTFNHTPTPSGTYYRRLEVETYVNNKDVKTDSWAWGVAYRINNCPNPPSNPSPTDGVTNVSLDADLDWSCSDPDGDVLYYTVYFEKNDPSPDNIIKNDQTGSYVNLGTLEFDTWYYWYVVAYDHTWVCNQQ